MDSPRPTPRPMREVSEVLVLAVEVAAAAVGSVELLVVEVLVVDAESIVIEVLAVDAELILLEILDDEENVAALIVEELGADGSLK